MASKWARNLAREACLGNGVVGDPSIRVADWGRFSPLQRLAPSRSSRPRNPDAGGRRGRLVPTSPTLRGEGPGPKATLRTARSHRDSGHRAKPQYHVPEERVQTCTKWRSSTPGQEGGQLPASSRRTLRAVSGSSEPETGPRRAPGREWAGQPSRKCLRSRPGARPRGLRCSASEGGGGRGPRTRPPCPVSGRLGEGGTPLGQRSHGG